MPNAPLIPPRVPLTDPRTGLIAREWYHYLMAQHTLTGGSPLTRTSDSNVTLTLEGFPNAALLAPVGLRLGWTGLLPINRGGTGADTAAGALAALGGVAQTYVDAGDAATLAAANAYTDTAAATAQSNAETYAASQAVAAQSAAETYADAGDATTLASANAHADAGDTSTLAAAEVYTDIRAVPIGGTTGQVLTKASNADRDTTWSTVPGGASALSGLSDVTLTTPSTDQVLTYDGTKWVNGSAGGGSSSVPTSAVRQTVHSGLVDSNGFPIFLSAGSGLSVNVSASVVPLVISFAAGFDTASPYSPLDYYGRVTADTTISGLPANSTVYLYAERNPSSGAIAFGYTTSAPIYSFVSPSANGTSIVPAMTSNNTPSPYVASASSYYVNDAQYAPWKLYNGVLNDGFGWVTQKSLGFPQWNKIDLGSAATVTKYTLYGNSAAFTTAPTAWSVEGSNTGAFTGEQTTLDSRSGQTTWTTAGLTFNIASPGSYCYYRLVITANNGHATETDVTEWVLMSAGSGFALSTHWFDIGAMTMWAPGGTATIKQRVFIGEATTNASGVTSVTTYALRGYYDSRWFPVAASTNYTKSHNLGLALPEGVNATFYFSPTGVNTDAGVAVDVFASSTNLVGHFMREATTQDSRSVFKFGFTNQVQSYAGSGKTSGYYRIIARRAW